MGCWTKKNVRPQERTAKTVPVSGVKQWDADGDGEISDEEREAAREALRAKIEENRRERFFEVDNGDDGALNLDEFAAIGALERLAERRPDALQKIFNRLDDDERWQRKRRGVYPPPAPSQTPLPKPSG